MARFEELEDRAMEEISTAKHARNPMIPEKYILSGARIALDGAIGIIRIFQKGAIDPASAIADHVKHLTAFGVSKDIAEGLVQAIVTEVRG